MSHYMGGLQIEPQIAIREKVYRYLRHQILTGEIPPGERLVESRLAMEIGASRTPIREALHNLEFEKIITSIPKVGYVVRGITKADVREICEIRIALESMAVRWALQNEADKLIPLLQENLERMARCVKKKLLGEAPGLDSQFHDLICQASGSRWLADLNHSLREYMLGLRLKSYTDQGLAQRALDGHRRIFSALKTKDLKSTEKAIEGHMKITIQDIITFALGGKSKGR